MERHIFINCLSSVIFSLPLKIIEHSTTALLYRDAQYELISTIVILLVFDIDSGLQDILVCPIQYLL